MIVVNDPSIIRPITPDDHDEPAGHIKTISGRWFDFHQPQVNIFDIAHALSMICRYGGHLPAHYSVAEHCLAVSHQLERTYGDKQLALAGLLHDAHEAYIGDIVGPLKRIIDGATNALRDIAYDIDLAIIDRYGLVVEFDDPRIKDVDRQILAWEMAMVRPHNGRTATSPQVSAHHFMTRFYRLGGVEQANPS